MFGVMPSLALTAPSNSFAFPAIAPELFESEFFGHARGAFTGAHKDRDGRFGLADGGAIFLDEVGEIPPALQGKLLRVLQEGQYERVGEDHTRTVDVRVIAATNRDLGKEVEAERFRQDLFYRLSVFPIHIAPLRERLEDVPLLAEHFMRKLNWRDRDKEPMRLSDENVRALQNYHYPGNVRELGNIIERAAILSNCFLYKLTVQQILDAMLLSEQRKQLDAIGNEPSIADGRSQKKIMTYAEMKNLERENLIAAGPAHDQRVHLAVIDRIEHVAALAKLRFQLGQPSPQFLFDAHDFPSGIASRRLSVSSVLERLPIRRRTGSGRSLIRVGAATSCACLASSGCW